MLYSLASLFRCLLSDPHSKPHPCRTMNRDPLLQLIDSSSTFDTGSLLRDIVLFAMVSPDPRAVQNRFMVQGLTHCKDIQAPTDTGMNPQHEFVVIELEDTKRTSPKRLFIVLERTASLVRPSPAHSSVSLAMKAPLLASASISSLSESLPSSDSLSPYKAVATDEFELTPSMPRGSPYQLPSSSASLATTGTLYTSTQSTSRVYIADDHFVGSKISGAYADLTLNITQIRPQSLSLFELAVLADTIHNHDPLYSILKHQCFWFVTTLCNVVTREYDCIMVTGSAPSLSRDEVNRAEDSVSSAMASSFRKYLQEKENEVHFIFYSECHLLKSRHR